MSKNLTLSDWAANTVASIRKQKNGEAKVDAIYRHIWCSHVKEDAEAYCLDNNVSEKQMYAILDAVANRYVHDGDYDCTLSYWDNIGSLVEAELRLLDERG